MANGEERDRKCCEYREASKVFLQCSLNRKIEGS